METTHEMPRMGMKRILAIENNYERMASSLNYASLEIRVRIWRKNPLRSSKSENDDEKYHHELFRHSGRIESEEVEPTMKKMKDLGERHLTDDKSFSRQTSKRI